MGPTGPGDCVWMGEESPHLGAHGRERSIRRYASNLHARRGRRHGDSISEKGSFCVGMSPFLLPGEVAGFGADGQAGALGADFDFAEGLGFGGVCGVVG
jgi:hypothetical protein